MLSMDDIVKQALAKWPHVPHCHGWLGLDARGNWYLRDDRTQAAGPFPMEKGSMLRHDKLIDFIHRNYAADEAGQWFRSHGNEHWEFDDSGLMRRRDASINDVPIQESDRRYR